MEDNPTGQNTGSSSIELLSVEDIMDVMSVSRSTVQRLMRRGAIQAIPVNAPQNKKWKPLRVRKQDLETALLGEVE